MYELTSQTTHIQETSVFLLEVMLPFIQLVVAMTSGWGPHSIEGSQLLCSHNSILPTCFICCLLLVSNILYHVMIIIMFRDRLNSTEMKRDVCILHWSLTEMVMPCCICSSPAICIYTPYPHSPSCHGVVEFWDSSEFPLNSVCSSCAWQPSSSLCDCSLGLCFLDLFLGQLDYIDIA